MTMRITFDLSEDDLKHFRKIMKAAAAAAQESDARKITDAAGKLLEDVKDKDVPEFITDRLAKLSGMIEMVHDSGWALPEAERKRVLSALAYFSDPQDLIPDHIPGLGFLDDAIMVELVIRELKHEIEAYEDFCKFRSVEAKRQGVGGDDLNRASWLVERRKQLHARMKRRRSTRGGVRRGSRSGSRGPFSLF